MRIRSVSSLGLAMLVGATITIGQSATRPSPAQHAIVGAAELKWRPLRPGAEIAIVSGNPDAAGEPFVMRMRYTGSVRVPPHWHPADEHITVLSGTFRVGMGGESDEATAVALTAGGYAMLPAKMPHFAWSKGDTVVQVHGLGPFVINYVNPADRPAAK